MKPFKPTPECEKCGSIEVFLRYAHAIAQEEHLICKCRKCDHNWLMAVKKPDKPVEQEPETIVEKVDESVKYYRALLEIKPDYAGVHHNLGLVLLRKGDTENAIFHFREALRINNDYAEVYNSLGAAMASKGEIKEAISHFRQALRIKPDFYEAQKNLSKLENIVDLTREVTLEFK